MLALNITISFTECRLQQNNTTVEYFKSSFSSSQTLKLKLLFLQVENQTKNSENVGKNCLARGTLLQLYYTADKSSNYALSNLTSKFW